MEGKGCPVSTSGTNKAAQSEHGMSRKRRPKKLEEGEVVGLALSWLRDNELGVVALSLDECVSRFHVKGSTPRSNEADTR